MGLADELERRLERVVEGFFSKAFRSEIQPAEIGRRLLREMEGARSVSMGAVYAPNRFIVRLSNVDHDNLSGLFPVLRSEFVQTLKENARQRRWKLTGPLDVSFSPDPDLSGGRFEVDASHREGDIEEQPTHPTLRLADPEAPQTWPLSSDRMTIGRLETSDVVVVDQTASRRHAELVRRDDRWWIVDLGAANGTLVNDALVKERPLKHGDRIRIGSTELVYLEDSEAGDSA